MTPERSPRHQSYEAAAGSPIEPYEANHGELLDATGRIQAQLNRNYRTDKPRTWEHVGGQEEALAMLRDVLEFLSGIAIGGGDERTNQ